MYNLESFWICCHKLGTYILGRFCSLQQLSSFIRLDGEQRKWFSSGFKSGLRITQGHSHGCPEALVVLTVCLGLLSCWELNLGSSLRSWALWNMCSPRMSLHIVAFIFFSSFINDAAPTMLYGRVLVRWWAVPDFDIWHSRPSVQSLSHQTRVQIVFVQVWDSFRCLLANWLIECYRDGCPPGRFSSIHRGLLELWQEWPAGS